MKTLVYVDMNLFFQIVFGKPFLPDINLALIFGINFPLELEINCPDCFKRSRGDRQYQTIANFVYTREFGYDLVDYS